MSTHPTPAESRPPPIAARPRPDPNNLFRRISNADPDFSPNCIFDIGANVGQTVGQIRKVYPAVPVHAFEPVASTCAILEAATAADTATRVHRLAFGARPGRAVMTAEPASQHNRVVPGDAVGPGAPREEVEVVAGDAFCTTHGIATVGILKIDAEGQDLDVLVGFHGMLVARQIHYVVVECGVSPVNRHHVPFNRFAEFMFAMGYGLFGLFPAGLRRRPAAETTGGPGIRGALYGDAVFLAQA